MGRGPCPEGGEGSAQPLIWKRGDVCVGPPASPKPGGGVARPRDLCGCPAHPGARGRRRLWPPVSPRMTGDGGASAQREYE